MSQCTYMYMKQACLGDASNVFVECQLAVKDDTEALHCRRRLDDSVAYRDMWHVVDTIASVN